MMCSFGYKNVRILVIVIFEKNKSLMSQYQRIEYLIGKDGKIVERALGISGSECVAITAEIESSLGKVETRELLPNYFENPDQNLDCNAIEQVQYDRLP